MPELPHVPRRGRILVIDDDRLIGTLLRDLLADEYSVTTETTPAHAVARVANGERYDLVLCDLHMPGMSGPDVLDALALLQPDVPQRFVYLTGGGVDARDWHALRHAPAGFLEKPFEPAALRRMVAASFSDVLAAPSPGGR